MTNFFYQLCIVWLYQPFLALLKILKNNPDSLLILIIIFIVLVIVANKLATAENKIKIRFLPQIISYLTVFAVVLILIVAWANFGPLVKDFLKVDTTTETPKNSPATPATKTTPSAPNTPTQQTTPAYQAPKQLFYSVSCQSCYAEGCSRNGYYYSGYDAASYAYYYNACKVCSCNSLVGHSFWK